MSSFKEIAKSINKKYKSGNVLVTGDFLPRVEHVSMGTLGADYATWGGVPLGCISTFAGQFSSGKTLAAVQTMANYQKKYPDKICIYIDAENTLSAQLDFLVKMTGLDISEDKFVIYNTAGKSAESIFEDIIELQNEVDNIGLIILDSAPALVSDSDLTEDFSKDNGMRASVAKSLGKFLKIMTTLLPRKNNALIVINQVRENGKTFTGATIYTEPAGYGPNYYSTLKVRFGTRKFTKDEDVNIAASKAEDTDGFRLVFAVTKNKSGNLSRGGGFVTYRFETGLDTLNDNFEIGVKCELIEHPNNLTYIFTNLNTGEVFKDDDGNLLKFTGRAKAIDYLRNHKEFSDMYFSMLLDHLNGSNTKSLLDEEDLKEITDEENNVNGKVEKKEEIPVDDEA